MISDIIDFIGRVCFSLMCMLLVGVAVWGPETTFTFPVLLIETLAAVSISAMFVALGTRRK